MNIILGGAQFGGNYGITRNKDHIDPEEIAEILDFALESGITEIDAGLSYGNIEESLAQHDLSRWSISTKIQGLAYITGENWKGNMRAAIERSLRFYQKDSFKVIYIHDLNNLAHEPQTNTVFKVLDRLKSEGLCEQIGVSIYSPEILARIEFDFDVIQFPNNALDHRMFNSGCYRLLSLRNRRLIARSLFLQGLLLDSDASKHLAMDGRDSLALARWFGFLQAGNIDPVEACISSVKAQGIDEVVVGVHTKTQLEKILELVNQGQLVTTPNFSNLAGESLLDPSNWSIK